MDSKKFDAWAMELSERRPSRRLVTTRLLGVAVTAITSAFPSANALAGRRRKRREPKVYKCNEDSCAGMGGKGCGRDGCYCYRHRGGHACVKGLINSNNKRCRKDRQCPGNKQVCVKSGPACGRGRGFCKRLCTKR